MRRLRLRALMLATIAGVGMIVSVKFLVASFQSARAGPERHSDFLIYYISARLLLDGKSPYDESAELKARLEYTGTTPAPGAVVLYLYPPTFLLLVVPFALLPLWTANYLWTLLQTLCALLACGYLLSRTLSGWARLIVLLWMVPWLPTVVTLRFGQISLMLLLSFLGLLRAMEKRSEIGAAMSLLLLSIKPTLVPLPFALLLLGRRLRALSIACVGLAGAVALTFLLFGPQPFRDYVAAMRVATELQMTNLSWRTSTYSLAAIASYATTREWEALLALDVAVFSIWAAIVARRGLFDAAATLPIAGILLSPHVFIYDVVLTLGVAPALARRAPRWSIPLLVTGFILPWISHILLEEPAYVVAWMIAVLVVVLAVSPAISRSTQAESLMPCGLHASAPR